MGHPGRAASVTTKICHSEGGRIVRGCERFDRVEEPAVPARQSQMDLSGRSGIRSHASFRSKSSDNLYDLDRVPRNKRPPICGAVSFAWSNQFRKYVLYSVSLCAGLNPASRIILRNSSSVVQFVTPAARTTFSSSMTEPTSLPPKSRQPRAAGGMEASAGSAHS